MTKVNICSCFNEKNALFEHDATGTSDLSLEGIFGEKKKDLALQSKL